MSPLVLASGSPRRRELLGRHGYTLDVRVPQIEERALPKEVARDFSMRMAHDKAAAVLAAPDEVVLAADTVVHLASILLGKPRDSVDAVRMLEALSGGWHEVTTGFCARRGSVLSVGAVTTRVRFRTLSVATIIGYVTSGEPLDKAGGYAIQGLGAALVAEIAGSYTNVVGLPLAEVVEALCELGLPDPLEESG